MQYKTEFFKNYKEKLLTSGIVLIMMLTSFSMIFVETVSADGDSATIWLIPSATDVEVGDNFNVTFKIDSGIETVSWYNVSRLNYNESSFMTANVSTNDVWFKTWTEATDKTIFDNPGFITNINASTSSDISGNNTAFVINFTTYGCGVLFINISDEVVREKGAGNFTLTGNNNTIVTIHPPSPSSFNAQTKNSSIINVTWTNGASSDGIYLEYAQDSPLNPWNIGNGNIIGNISNTFYEHAGLPSETNFYYKAWGWNQTNGLISISNSTDDAATFGTNITISGQVKDSQNASVLPGTSVMVFKQGFFEGEFDNGPHFTNASGGFCVDATNAGPGMFCVEVSREGYVGFRNWTIDASDGEQIDLGIILLEPLFDESETAHIKGKITADGQPIENASVMLLDTDFSHMLETEDGGEDDIEKETETDENGIYNFNISYRSDYKIIAFTEGYYANLSPDLTITSPNQVKWSNISLEEAEPDSLEIDIEFTDLDDAKITINRSIIAASRVLRFSLDINPEIGNGNSQVDSTEIQKYMQMLSKFGPSFKIGEEEEEQKEGDGEEMHGPDFLSTPLALTLDSSDFTKYKKGSHKGTLDNIVNTTADSNQTIYYNATFNITLDGSVKNALTHPFNITTVHNETVNLNLTIIFGNLYNISSTSKSTNVTLSNTSCALNLKTGYNDSIDALAYANITLEINQTSLSLPIIETPTWNISDRWTFKYSDDYPEAHNETYKLRGKPLKPWDKERYKVGDENLSYTVYEVERKNETDDELYFVTINDLDWLNVTSEKEIDYLVNDLDFPLYIGKTWTTISWWGGQVNATVNQTNATKITENGTFNDCVYISYINESGLAGMEWYSPEVKFFVNRSQNVPNSYLITYDLLSYSLAPYIESMTVYANDSDQVPDGLINSLDVNVTVNTSKFYDGPQDLILEGPLYKENFDGPPVDISWVFEENKLKNIDASTASTTVKLSYSGGLIRASGVDGPYTIQIELREKNEWGPGEMLDFYSFEVLYNQTDFEEPAASIISIEDYGNDTDGPKNGKFDYLTVNLTINVTKTGNYSVHSGLDKVINYGNWDEWRWVTGTGSPPKMLAAGEHTIVLNFNGEEIYEKAYNGPYKLHLEIVDTDANTIVARNETDTKSYLYENFETPTVYFNKSVFNESGMHDYLNDSGFLTINASIIVETSDGAGEYELCGGLHYSTNDTESWGEFVTGKCEKIQLIAGTNDIPLNFDMGEIYQKMTDDNYNGSFKVGLSLSERVGDWVGPDIDWINYFTMNYSASNLPKPPISMEIFDDSIVGGGETLQIQAYINITSDEFANQTYDLHGGVHYNQSGWWYHITGMGKETYLSYGQNIVLLNFSGMEIAASGKDGPYMIWMGLDSLPNHDYITHDEYITAGHSAGDFDSPPIQFVSGNTSSFVNGTDYFTVEVSLNVSQPGDYHIGGGLHWIKNQGDWDEWMFITGAGEEYHLTENTNISINFDQGMIKSQLPSDYNDKLKIHLGIENVTTWNHITHLEYDTPQKYSKSNFSTSAITINSTSYGIDGNGDFYVNITYYATSSKNCTIHGGFHDLNWWFIAGTWNPNIDLSQAENTVNISFGGNEIFNSMKNGPYKIWIGIENSTTHKLLANKEFEVIGYSYTDFAAASSGVRIIREQMIESTVDYMNSTGTKTFLTVNVSFNVTGAGSGTYWLDGGLNYVSGDMWEFITGTGNKVTLTPGTITIPLNFNAGDIYSSQKSGKYKVWIGLRNETNWEDIDNFEYTTKWYSYTTAPPPPVKFVPMDEGDSSSCYINGTDFLTINLTLNVSDASHAGTYDLHGGIHYKTNEGWWQHITGTGEWVELENGLNSKVLNFNAGEVQENLPDGYSNNLSIWIGLNDIGSWDEISHIEFITPTYAKSDFPSPKISMTPTSDSVWGSNFTINVTIDVNSSSAGIYDLHGGVHWIDTSKGWDEWRFITGTGNQISLSAGQNNVSLNFSAGDIYTVLNDNGYTGKLTVWMGIQNISTWREVTHADYTTQSTYSKNNFNPPSLIINCTGDFYNTISEQLQVNVSINGTSELLAQNNDYEINAGIHWIDNSKGWEEWRFITGFYRMITLSDNITIPLNFSGTAISASEQTGPFQVWVGVSEIGKWSDLAHDDYTTTTDYSTTQFAVPPIKIINNDNTPTDYANNTEYLTINVTLNATQTGNYFLEGCIHWKEGYNWKWISWEGKEINITSTGIQIIPLNFDGNMIKQAEKDGWSGGPLVAWIAVRNLTNWNELSRLDEYETNSYIPNNFADSMVSFNRSTSLVENLVNSSGGGSPYDYLNITVSLNMSQGATSTYKIFSGLFDPVNDTLIVAKEKTVNTSQNSVILNFSGEKIYKKNYNGTFEFRAKIFDVGNKFECDKLMEKISSYTYDQFIQSTPEAMIGNNYSNYTNGNGDLVIRVNISISQNHSMFKLYGDLFDNTSSTFITKAKNVSYFNNQTGNMTVEMVFNKTKIISSGVAAPYKLAYLQLSIYNEVDDVWEELDMKFNPFYTQNGYYYG